MKNQTLIPVLPVEAYTSEAWFKEEQRKIFTNTWQFAGFVEDVAGPGDYVTVQAGLANILVVRGRDQKLRAFHNLCRHRGTQLLRAVGKNQKAITCPYHDWTYSLNGELINIPEKEKEFPDVDMCKLKLHNASVDIWRGMIFVHPKADAMPITKWFEGVWEKLGPHQPEDLVEYEGTVYDEVINANWKIVAENYMDVYHLAHLHSETLNMYDHAKAEFGWEGPHYVFWEPAAKKYKENIDKLAPFKLIEGMEGDLLGAFVPWLFPNFGLSETESTWSIFHAIPLAPDKTRVVVRSKVRKMTNWEFTKQQMKSYSSWHGIMGGKTKYGNTNQDDPMATGDFMAEDVFACEQQQKSLQNPMMSVGASAKYGESTVRKFQSVVQEWMESDSSEL